MGFRVWGVGSTVQDEGQTHRSHESPLVSKKRDRKRGREREGEKEKGREGGREGERERERKREAEAMWRPLLGPAGPLVPPPWRQLRGKYMVSFVNCHSNATPRR